MSKANKIELMAPAGDFATLTTACKAGADAVYFGVDDFSMRSGKKNFKVSDLEKIKKICNSYPRRPKTYLTLNTIVYDHELKKIEKIIEEVKGKVDAVIVSDFAAIDFCRKYGVPFFISTQASVSNKKAADFFKEIGAKRIVLARELNIKQIKEIIKAVDLETEIFVHGAMCVALSGRCFTSQFLFNSSANRGECLHPCRRAYKVKDKEKGYELELFKDTIMSAKDLCTLPFIEELKKAGVDSFKIEGRNRDVRYVDTEVRVYRTAIDEKLTTGKIISLMKDMESVFQRGFSSGFYLGKPTFSDFAEFENSASSVSREFVGKVTHFYPKAKAAQVSLVKSISLGERIIFVGEKTGVEELKIEEMEIEKRKVDTGNKGEALAIKTPFKTRKGDEIYRLIEKKSL